MASTMNQKFCLIIFILQITMNNLSTSVESLFNLALYELSYSMNEDLLKSILKNYPTSIIFKILWKVNIIA